MQRELRYLVVKLKDMEEFLSPEEQQIMYMLGCKVDDHRQKQRRHRMQAIVIESDWPEYEKVWALLAARLDQTPVPAPEPTFTIAQIHAYLDGCRLTNGGDRGVPCDVLNTALDHALATLEDPEDGIAAVTAARPFPYNVKCAAHRCQQQYDGWCMVNDDGCEDREVTG